MGCKECELIISPYHLKECFKIERSSENPEECRFTREAVLLTLFFPGTSGRPNRSCQRVILFVSRDNHPTNEDELTSKGFQNGRRVANKVWLWEGRLNTGTSLPVISCQDARVWSARDCEMICGGQTYLYSVDARGSEARCVCKHNRIDGWKCRDSISDADKYSPKQRGTMASIELALILTGPIILMVGTYLAVIWTCRRCQDSLLERNSESEAEGTRI